MDEHRNNVCDGAQVTHPEQEALSVSEVAARLNGCEYGQEGSPELWSQMKAAGLVAVFGASDDLMEFRGAIYDEIGVYGGGTAYLTDSGLMEDREPCCIHAEKARERAVEIEARWAVDGEPAWTYRTVLPHSTFEVLEDGEVYCRGIVFSLSDVSALRADSEASQ